MTRWTCPNCDREFGRARQSHICVPGISVAECFAPWPPAWREIYDSLAAHLDTLGPVHADAVRVGVFLKHERKFAEIRPKARCLSVEIVLPRVVDHPRIARRIRQSSEYVVHIVKVVAVTEVDDQLRDWLTESCQAAGRD